ncbi:MAG: RNA polymerase sigma factor [Gaiellaceae bacterium]
MPRPPRGWLLGIARLTLANQRRTVTRREALIARVGWERNPEWDSTDPRPLIEALNCLSDLDQETLLLSARDGLNAKGAAQVLGW